LNANNLYINLFKKILGIPTFISIEKSIQPHDNKFVFFININTSADIEKLERL